MGVSAAQVFKNLLGLLGNLSAIGVVLTPIFFSVALVSEKFSFFVAMVKGSSKCHLELVCGSPFGLISELSWADLRPVTNPLHIRKVSVLQSRLSVTKWSVRPRPTLSFVFVSLFYERFTTLRAIIDADNVGGRTCFPFVFTWLNAAALVVYAGPKHDWWVIVVNAVAVVVEGVYCYLYIVYARGWNRVIAYIMAAVQLVLVVALLVIQFTVFRDGHNAEVREVFFGWIVAGTAILMYLFPFKETSVAAWTRNVESLTPLLSLAYLVNASIWTGFASIKPLDRYLQISNGTGILSAFLQCLVWLICRPGQLQIANGSGILSAFLQCLVWLIFRPEHQH
ncbi:bidirectional sugar transporter SWEET4-like isoform X2 [Aegilops tauschii subsp. strangulata]|uniref:Protein RUPTURED POLLEN GRAIN 1 n=1 Tax=Aegilops tauschii TaxID=37682 RepID=M8BPM7_AEGTA